MAPFFCNLLPEGTLRDYLAKRANVKPQREFFLAAALGQDLPGAVQITSRDSAAFADSMQSEHKPGDDATQVLHFSLAGVQLKFSAVEKATGGLTVPADGVGGRVDRQTSLPNIRRRPRKQFALLAAKAGLPEKITLNAATDTVDAFRSAWRNFDNEALSVKTHDAIDKHLNTVPLWRTSVAPSRRG